VSRARALDPEKQGAEGMPTAAKGVSLEDLSVGQEASLSKTVTEPISWPSRRFPSIRTPCHLDAQYAAGTMFKERRMGCCRPPTSRPCSAWSCRG